MVLVVSPSTVSQAFQHLSVSLNPITRQMHLTPLSYMSFIVSFPAEGLILSGFLLFGGEK